MEWAWSAVSNTYNSVADTVGAGEAKNVFMEELSDGDGSE